ncbi:hypothetical protein [Albibacterium profundi]|uniref:Head decoration protein n=1 Tax=Albibacterium profundi TaxID=3134906 RepID=A0ABV5CF17_9SPHI
MALRVKRQKDERHLHSIVHRLADIPGGVTVNIDTLVPGTILKEGTVIAKGENGMYNVVKTATITKAATTTDTDYEVSKGNNFKVGDFFAAKVGAKSFAITAINRDDPEKDVITLGTTLGAAVPLGTVVFEAKAESTGTASALKHAPLAVVGESHDVEANENLFASAMLIGVLKADTAPAASAEIKAAIPTIIFI